jgi:hypothetical protein
LLVMYPFEQIHPIPIRLLTLIFEIVIW